MKKYIEIIENHNNKITQNKNITKKVAKGYAFNYLIPNRLAELATKGKIRHLQMLQKLSSDKKSLSDKLAEKIQIEVSHIRLLHIRKKCGNEYNIFGSVSEQDIKEKISDLIGEQIEKQQITIEPIKKLGAYNCNILIGEDRRVNLTAKVLPYYT